MNGRVYDYNLGRFLSVDPFVHGGSQGLNPYSYIMNNPLAGTDPTGYEPKVEKVQKDIISQTTGSKIKTKVGTITTTTVTEGNQVTKITTVETTNGHKVTQVEHSDGDSKWSSVQHFDLNNKQSTDSSASTIASNWQSDGGCITASCAAGISGHIESRTNAQIDESLDELGENVQMATGGVSLPTAVIALSRKLIRQAAENIDDVAKSAPKALAHLRIGHTIPWASMTKAQRKAFQHSYSRHGAELGLPAWKQGNAAALQKQFNTVVGHIRETGTNLGTRMKPFNGKSTRVNYFESTQQGTKYYYYETLGGQFVSAGKAGIR